MIGSVLDKYEVLQKVGEGGMATVYRGRHTTLDRDVAIKVLHPHLSSSTRNRKRFAREARAIEHLRHDNILEIFDYSGIDSNDCYIITEFVQGKTLTALTEDVGALPSELVSLIGIHLCQALEYAHESGILHRDLKPENVMVRVDGRVKLMDFGIARFLDESQVTLTGALIGSPAFMSPEQAREDTLDARSDLFSLGTVLFYLVTGGLPFTGSNPSLILKKVIEGERPSVNDLCPTMSASLADVIECLLSTEPDGRFNSAVEVSAALRTSLDEVGISVDDPQWCVTAYLRDPAGYTRDLDLHVRRVLLECGRSSLEGGDPLSALRLFNRLLSIDDGNEEVLTLVQSLHTEPARSDSSRAWWALLALPLIGLGAMGIWWTLPTTKSPVARPTPLPMSPVPLDSPPPPVSPNPTLEAVPAPIAAPVPTKPAPVVPLRPRPTPAAPLPDPPVEPDRPATVRIRTNLVAEVWLEGRKLGTTRTPLRLDPGTHVLELRGEVVETARVTVDVASGETLTRNIRLNARPASIRLSSPLTDDCTVVLDGQARGSIGSLSGRLEIEAPDEAGHHLVVSCPGKEDYVKVWSTVVLPGERVP